MYYQYLKFFLNGGVLGVAALALQWLIFNAIGGDSATAYSLATALTYLPLLVVNFMIQKTWIFYRTGLFWRFVVANLAIMALVSLLSPLCRYVIDALVGAPWGDRGGFALAALLGSMPSFLLKRYWVFRAQATS